MNLPSCSLPFFVLSVVVGCADSTGASAPNFNSAGSGTGTVAGDAGTASNAGSTSVAGAGSSGSGSISTAGGGGASGGGATGGGATGGSANAAGAAGAGVGGAAGSVGGGGSPAIDPSTPGDEKADLVPKTGLRFGAYVDGGQLAPREALLERKLAIRHRFFAWTDNWIDDDLKTDVAAKRIPMATWEPRTASLADITAGQFDAMAHERAQAAKAVGKPIFLRFAHEMNGDWYPWGGAKNGNDASGPQKYVAAWRHLHDLFVADGATNVVWVWCPNIGGSPNADWNQPSAYYPGDAYVDWVGVDGYNWGTSQSWSKWTAFNDILGSVYASYAAMGKPMMVAETGSVEGGGDKAAWVVALGQTLKTFPAVKAFVYFDTYDELNKTDWKIDSSMSARDAFVALVKDPYFNP